MNIRNLIRGVIVVFFSLSLTAQVAKVAPYINGCEIYPSDHIWNIAVDELPVHSNSSNYINSIGFNGSLKADFGSGLWAGGPIGIPYVIVPGSQSKVAVNFMYDDESDPGPYPVPPNPPIEGGDASDGDRHILMLDEDNCILYELYNAYPNGDGTWSAGSGAIYDLNSYDLRPDGWTSADAAGLPILPGLMRYDEVDSGEVTHAIRFTTNVTQKAYVWPARHYASSNTSTNMPPMGLRLRLKADVDISGYDPQMQTILRGLKKYGMILADNGSPWFISGVPDERWDNDLLHSLGGIKGSDFEAVDMSSQMISNNSGQANVEAPNLLPEITQYNVQTAGLEGENLNFSANATDADGDSLLYSWAFGDGLVTIGDNVEHAYQSAGVYVVKVTVFDGKGGSVSFSSSIVIAKSVNEEEELLPNMVNHLTVVPINDQGVMLSWQGGESENRILKQFLVYQITGTKSVVLLESTPTNRVYINKLLKNKAYTFGIQAEYMSGEKGLFKRLKAQQ